MQISSKCNSIDIKPDTVYKLSGWIKTQNVGSQYLGANISLLNRFYTTESITGTTETWKYVEMFIKASPKAKKITICNTFNVNGLGNNPVG